MAINLDYNNEDKDELFNKLKDKTFYIKTYGCQMNVNDSSEAKTLFEEFGMTEVFEESQAYVVFISTCCVREKAELKIYSYIGSLKSVKQNRDDQIIIISGCMSEQDGVRAEIFSRFPFVDIVVGTNMTSKLPSFIKKRLETQHKVNYELDLVKEFKLPLRSSNRVSEFVTIMTGCNNFCSYCIVPYVRGRECSRDAGEIIAEINKFVENGCSEVTLLGQNVNSYGLDSDGIKFVDLLKRVSLETNIKRIRFMTSHPKDLTDELLEYMSLDPKMCRHIHLPLQSGSNDVLNNMNRKYDTNRYFHIIDHARKLMPDIEFTTDLIVGFPGETEQDFSNTLDAVRKARFASAFMFKYSKRSGTPAAEYENQLDKKTKSQRLSKLIEVEAEIKKEVYSSYVGKSMEILTEGESKTKGMYTGKTSSAITVNYKGEASEIGKLVMVKIVQAKTNTLLAIKSEEI